METCSRIPRVPHMARLSQGTQLGPRETATIARTLSCNILAAKACDRATACTSANDTAGHNDAWGDTTEWRQWSSKFCALAGAMHGIGALWQQGKALHWDSHTRYKSTAAKASTALATRKQGIECRVKEARHCTGTDMTRKVSEQCGNKARHCADTDLPGIGALQQQGKALHWH
eukprot:1969251-Amphidinium_carterae.2